MGLKFAGDLRISISRRLARPSLASGASSSMAKRQMGKGGIAALGYDVTCWTCSKEVLSVLQDDRSHRPRHN